MISASMLVEGSSMMEGFVKSKPGSRLVLKSRLIAFFAISLGILESHLFQCGHSAVELLNLHCLCWFGLQLIWNL